MRLGEFALGRPAGGGAFGTVFRARDEKLDRRVAVKVFAPRDAPAGSGPAGDGPAGAPAGGVDLVLHEARAAARLSHPHVVRVFRTETADWTAELRAAVAAARDDGGEGLPPAGAGRAGYIVSEYVGGGTLQRQFRRYHAGELAGGSTGGRPAWATPHGAVRFLLPVAEALAHAHAAGVVHRDVKPANVLLRRDGSPALADFGIARAAPRPVGLDDTLFAQDVSTRGGAGWRDGSGTLSADGRVLGTPSYMAPEQAKPWGTVGPAADVYSLAVVLWELLAGARMYRGESADVLDRIIGEPAPPLPASVPKPVRRLVSRCLSKDAADRPADGFALAAALRAVLPPEAAPWTRRRVLASGVAAAGALAVPAGLWVGLSRDETDPRLRPSRSGWTPGPPVEGAAPAAGLRRVEVDTRPRGAAAWLVRLDDRGRPDPGRRYDLPERTPSAVDVPPGAYLLVAEGGAGRPGGPGAVARSPAVGPGGRSAAAARVPALPVRTPRRRPEGRPRPGSCSWRRCGCSWTPPSPAGSGRTPPSSRSRPGSSIRRRRAGCRPDPGRPVLADGG